MSFRDELNSIKPDMRILSEQEVYEKLLYREYKRIKEEIKEDAKIQVYKNLLTGKVRMLEKIIRSGIEDKEYNRIQVKNSRFYKIGDREYDRRDIDLNEEVTTQIINKHFFSNYADVSVSLTEIGRQYIKDLTEMVKADDITFSFYPYLSYSREIELSGFDVFEKINLEDIVNKPMGERKIDLKKCNINSGVNIHYEIML